MKINKENLQAQIKDMVTTWDLSGHTLVLDDQEVISEYTHGYGDRDHKIKKDPQAPYVFNGESRFFVGLCILKLVDLKKIKLEDTLDMYIPEYPQGHKVTIFHMVKENSGIKDFFYGSIMVDLEKDPDYKALSPGQRLVYEKEVYHKNRSFDKVMATIKDAPLEYKPGAEDEEESKSNASLLAEVVRRVSKVCVCDFLKAHIFDPLKMDHVKKGCESSNISYGVLQNKTLVRIPSSLDQDDLFTMTQKDVKNLLVAFSNRQIFSKKLWHKMLKYDNDNIGLIFSNANGFACADATYLGYGAYMYFNVDSKIAFVSLANEVQKSKYKGDSWHYFRRDFREIVTAMTTYPLKTKIVALNKKNFWYAKDLSVREDQNNFVLDAKSSIGMAYVNKTMKTYVQMEGQTAVGLLVLDIDHKRANYHIDIILVDQKFQGRGYGKEIVKFAVDKLTKAGAKKLTIGVSRANEGAKKIYMNAGFKPHTVYEEGMELELIIKS